MMKIKTQYKKKNVTLHLLLSECYHRTTVKLNINNKTVNFTYKCKIINDEKGSI